MVGGGGPSMLWGRFTADAVGRVPGNIVAPGNPAPNVPVVDLFARAQAEMGTVSSFTVNNPHRDNATVRFGATRAPTHEITFTSDNMVFDGATGAVISPAGNTINAVQKVTNVLGGIHFAFFGGTAMRVLYFLCGLAGTIMIGAGLVMFMAKRRAKARSAAAARFYGFVDRMNVAAIGGALFACASYFWALRLLPQSLSDPSGGFPGVGVYAAIRAVPLDQAARSDLELYAFYFAWGVAGAHALLRAPHKAWFEQFAAVAALCIGLPVDRLSRAEQRHRLDDCRGRLESRVCRTYRVRHRPRAGGRGVEDARHASRRARGKSGGHSRSVAGGLMYFLSALLCAYAGFAALCAITARNVPLVWPKPPSQGVTRALRAAGFLLLALAWVPCYLNWDVPMGTAAWVMILAASGFALVFPFAYAPKRSVQAGGIAAPLALIALLLG